MKGQTANKSGIVEKNVIKPAHGLFIECFFVISSAFDTEEPQ